MTKFTLIKDDYTYEFLTEDDVVKIKLVYQKTSIEQYEAPIEKARKRWYRLIEMGWKQPRRFLGVDPGVSGSGYFYAPYIPKAYTACLSNKKCPMCNNDYIFTNSMDQSCPDDHDIAVCQDCAWRGLVGDLL